MRIFTQIYLVINKVTTPHPPHSGPPSPPNKGEGFDAVAATMILEDFLAFRKNKGSRI